MKDKGVWARPENFYMVFRCTSVQYAETFLNNGQIKFNTPESWVKYAFEKGDGRGDKLEGTMATFHVLDADHFVEFYRKYGHFSDLIPLTINQRIYLKRARNISLPCFCFYILKNSMFECPNVEGKQKLSTIVPASYFKDFMDNLDPCEVEKLDKKDKPAVIIITDFEEFKQRIISALMNIGLKREEIIITRVRYFDFDQYGELGWWDFGQKSPMELCIKDKRFKSQSEGRIIINTDDTRIKRILEKPIEIGSLKDIASVSNTYLYEGMRIELTADLKLLN